MDQCNISASPRKGGSGGKGRPRADQAEAARRVIAEGPVPVGVLAAELEISYLALVRWIIRGKTVAGVRIFLDGFSRPSCGWMTSEAAIVRFGHAGGF